MIVACRRLVELVNHPKWPEGMVKQELSAVDNEYRRNKDDVLLRKWALAMRHFPSPLNKFETGSFQSLNTANPLSQLKNHHQRFFCNENMALIAVSHAPLDELQRMIFSALNATKLSETKCERPTWLQLIDECEHSEDCILQRLEPNESLFLTSPEFDDRSITAFWLLPEKDGENFANIIQLIAQHSSTTTLEK